jgi:hypothetical protein
MIVAHAQQPPFRKLLGRSPPSVSLTGRATVLIRPNPAKPSVTPEWCTWVPRELRFTVTTTGFRQKGGIE